jgi:hypothetical protein
MDLVPVRIATVSLAASVRLRHEINSGEPVTRELGVSSLVAFTVGHHASSQWPDTSAPIETEETASSRTI